jgi:hypothetical protein
VTVQHFASRSLFRRVPRAREHTAPQSRQPFQPATSTKRRRSSPSPSWIHVVAWASPSPIGSGSQKLLFQGCLNGRPTVKITVRTSTRVRVYPADRFLPSGNAGLGGAELLGFRTIKGGALPIFPSLPTNPG